MRYKRSWFPRFCLGILAAVAIASPAGAAERVYFKFGSLELYLSVEALDNWVETGTADTELSGFLNLLKPQQRQQLRGLLQTRYDENYFNLAYMSYTSVGEQFLRNVGQIVQTRNKGNGFEDLRTAFVNASKDEEGLSFINVLQQYPNDVAIDVNRVMGLVQRTNGLIADTDRFMDKLETVATQATSGGDAIASGTQTSPFSQDLRQSGPLSTQQQRLQVQGRNLRYDLYHPTQLRSPAPVVVITAGFGAEQDFFEELAHHLASYGFAVAVPEHAGSNNKRRQAFFRGEHKELFEATEYLDRPREVTAVLDDLEQRNPSEFQQRLNLKQVGVFSHSFGGPTALSLGGADLNFQRLQQRCGEDMDLLNISLYYQCHALKLPQDSPPLEDERVKALFLLGPFSNALFGPQEMGQLDLPVFWEATNIDLPAPLMLEQMPMFEALTTPDRYLAVSKGLPHAHITFEVMAGLVQETEVERLAKLSMTYQKAMTVAFFKTHVAQEESTFKPSLRSSYAQAISEVPYRLHLLNAETSKQLF